MSFSTGVVTLPPAFAGDTSGTFKYFDSDPEAKSRSKPYTTIIGIHGVGFNSSIWSPWLPYLQERNIRLLSYNRRGYEGSSPLYVPPGPPQPGKVDVTARYVLDLLGFMKFAVEELGVPEKDVTNQTGGVVLLGWSKGCIYPIALMTLMPQGAEPVFPFPGDFNTFRPMIESHLRSILLYEPPGTASARPPTADITELHVSESELPSVFQRWVLKKVPKDLQSSVLASWEEGPVSHDFQWMLGPDSGAIEKVAIQAFGPVPPSIGLGLLIGAEATEYCKDMAGWISDRIKDQSNTIIKVIPGAGHFAMITHPKEFTEIVEETIRSLKPL